MYTFIALSLSSTFFNLGKLQLCPSPVMVTASLQPWKNVNRAGNRILQDLTGFCRVEFFLRGKSAEPIYEVNFGRANSSISHQLKYVNTVSWIGGNVAVHMLRKVDNPECKVISLIVDADMERCGYVASLYICVEITHFSRWCGCVLKFQFRRVNCADAISKVHIVNTE